MVSLTQQSSSDCIQDHKAINQLPTQDEETEALRRVVHFLLEYYRNKSPDAKRSAQEDRRASCTKSD